LRLNGIRARKKRSGVSPIVAELCLIAVLLISAVILTGFLFDTISVYAAPAEVAAQATFCSASGDSEVCQVALSNVGSRDVNTDGSCSMTVGGSNLKGTIQNGGTVRADGSLFRVSCIVSGAIASVGSLIAGTIALTNGAFVYFTAVTN
jgi:FlaG/FlaF family flagellin (archaellin)